MSQASSFSRRRKHIKLTSEEILKVNYKSIGILQAFVMDCWRIVPRRTTRIKKSHQRVIRSAIEKARFLALLPYCDRH